MKILSYIPNPRTFIIVSIGVLMTIISAVITNNLLEKNNQKITNINKQESSIEIRIENSWQFLQESERKLDLAINILALRVQRNPSDRRLIDQYFNEWFSRIQEEEVVGKKDVKFYISLVKKFKAKTTEDINDLYLEKISLEHERDKILEVSMFLKNLALLFQILGLILVLSKN
jgi:hypothetical protein